MSDSPESDAIAIVRPLAVAVAASAQATRIKQRMAERSADRARAQAEQERPLEEMRREGRGADREVARRGTAPLAGDGKDAPLPAGAGARRPGLRWAQGRGPLSGRGGRADRPAVPARDNEVGR